MGNTNRIIKGDNCNKTQLALSTARSRMIIHRDYDAHMNRFGHVLKHLYINKPKVLLDVGCGDKQLAMAIYSNKKRKTISEYHCVDLRDITISGLIREGYPPPFNIKFHKQDVTKDLPCVNPDIIVCFEVIEHVTKEKGINLLNSLEEVMIEKSTLFLSTPCYNENKGQANNHIYEWEYQELKDELDKHFIIENVYGTFMDTGIGHNKQMLEDFFGSVVWGRLKSFFDSSTLSNMVAPLFPEKSRNCMWILKKR